VFDAAAARFDLSPTFLRLVAWQESRFRTDAVSTAGAIGIMQLMPNTAAELGVDPKNARDNIFGGAAYLRQMLDRFGGRIDLALAAYNAGPTRVAQIQATPAIAETQGYVAELLDRLAQNASTFAGTTPLSSLEKGALP
jgi:soluble lytic murein transglycosylase-like protein